MTTRDRVRASQDTMARAIWHSQQSTTLFESSQETISQSIRLMEMMRGLLPNVGWSLE
ncbi:hypothetical protein [Roseobacter cerasinus]|uniref:hypothetical protein n=1 Tax=Roseobacter cerasinus TaxID=2602289 RepID=UPI00135C412A|nr:hypothetical protein [Roseobacter cerasinus]